MRHYGGGGPGPERAEAVNTPVWDFARDYAEKKPLRLHVPGHKGAAVLGPEPWDLTEMDGADSLYEAAGILRESETNAGAIFGCPTFYSAEGSSLAVRAMLYLLSLYAKKTGRRPLIAAGRNAHKSFVSGAALLDLEVAWIYPGQGSSYLSCCPAASELEAFLADLPEKPVAVYLTSPDYLGNMADIGALSRVCHRHGVLLAVDGAHGAYLRFLPESRHPMDLGADLCCASAHKTLPVLTGGAYLHIGKRLPEIFSRQAKNALALFGSTSPSYLILESLDRANGLLAGEFPRQLRAFLPRVRKLRAHLEAEGWEVLGDEPMKLTLAPKGKGYRGAELAELLLKKGIVCEFYDRDFLVMMLTPQLGPEGLARLEKALDEIPSRRSISETPPGFSRPERVLSIREAMLAPGHTVPAAESGGRILAAATVGCPPAVPIVVSGERIPPDALAAFAYYGIGTCEVL